MAELLYADGGQYVSFGGIVMSITTNESKERPKETVDYFVDEQSEVTEHVLNPNATITISGRINAATEMTRRGIPGPTTPQERVNFIAQVDAEIDALPDVVTLVTASKVWPMVVATSIRTSRSPNSPYHLDVEATFREYRMAPIDRRSIPPKVSKAKQQPPPNTPIENAVTPQMVPGPPLPVLSLDNYKTVNNFVDYDTYASNIGIQQSSGPSVQQSNNQGYYGRRGILQ